MLFSVWAEIPAVARELVTLWLMARSAAETELTPLAPLPAPPTSGGLFPESPVTPGLIGELLSVVELVPLELSGPEDAVLSEPPAVDELLRLSMEG